MAAELISGYSPGRIAWQGARDREGHREFTIIHQVETTSSLDGPQVVMNAPGLPLVGSLWTFGNDLDLWAFCYPDMRVTPDQTRGREPHVIWSVEQKFGTRPLQRCQDTTIENPLNEPQDLSGSTRRKTIEANTDRNGTKILSSSHEPVLGTEVEFDDNDHIVTVEQNVLSLEQDTFLPLINTVNDATLWGFAARKVKLASVSWSRQLYGVCTFFYTRRFEFEINDNTFDTLPTDQGTKALAGQWDDCPPTAWNTFAGVDKTIASDFIRVKDPCNEELITVQLDGNGEPNLTDTPVAIPAATGSASGKLEYYPQSNFLTLGIPTTL